jgi:predicted aspartyl protease
MGRVMTKVKLANQTDIDNARDGLIPPAQVRRAEADGLADTGAVLMVIPAELAGRLGVAEVERRTVRYADGRRAERSIVGGLLIEILGRRMVGEAVVEAAGTGVLIGQIPLEARDLIVDPATRDLRKNPRSPDLAQNDLLRAE